MSEAVASQANPDAAPGSRRKLLLGALILVLAGGGAAAWFVLGSTAPTEPKPAEPIYFDVDSSLIVNFQDGGRIRYLQVGIQVMTRNPTVVERLKAHLPVVRNNLILLFSEQSVEELSSRDGKAALRDAALAEVQSVLIEHYGDPGVEAVYFTSFVMQ